MFSIRRLHKIDDKDIPALNLLFDEGMVWDRQQGELFFSDPNNALFVAEDHHTIVGFLSAHRLQRFDRRKAEVLIYEVSVAEKQRKQGIGKALMTEVKKWAKEQGADEVWVLTNRTNAAGVALYASMGGTFESHDEVMYTFKI